ncbi:MAG: S41 family peptidase [Firmicutes bacterium]|nr:S41 family peptidase [Bacillota bacterium]
MKDKKSQTQIILVATLVFIGCSSLGWWWGDNLRRGKYRDLIPALYSIGILKFNYYQPVSAARLMKVYWKTGNINRMLESLQDPYTEFLDQSKYNELVKETEGSYGGIGVYLAPGKGPDAGGLVIEKVIDGSPAQAAGLRPGDQLIAVDQVPVQKAGDAFQMITGKIGTKVSLRISRPINGQGLPGDQRRRQMVITITRRKIEIPTVIMKLAVDPIIGEYAFIKITQFAKTTPGDLGRKLKELERRNCKGLVLDLRGNPGGLLDESIEVIGHFLPENSPALYIYHRGRLVEVRRVGRGYTHPKWPVIVLVNRYSASAAEVVAGALKDQKRAILVGTPTFGKDLIQDVRELPGGGALKFTVFNYYTSGKVNIHKRGVQPNQIVEEPNFHPGRQSESLDSTLDLQNDYARMALKILRKQVLKLEKKLAG